MVFAALTQVARNGVSFAVDSWQKVVELSVPILGLCQDFRLLSGSPQWPEDRLVF